MERYWIHGIQLMDVSAIIGQKVKKMTFEELLKMPKGMGIEEYNKLLKKQRR